MSRLFLYIYSFFRKHPAVRNLILIGSFTLFSAFALQIRLEEDITHFFPATKDARIIENVFKNLKMKDRLLVMLSSKDSLGTPASPEGLIGASTRLKEALQEKAVPDLVTEIRTEIDPGAIGKVTDLIYGHLPLFLTEDDYARMDSLLQTEEIDRQMRANYMHLLSPAGMAFGKIFLRDPVGIGTSSLEKLKDFQATTNYQLYKGHLFSRDMSTLLCFITPRYGTGSTGNNDRLIRLLEEELDKLTRMYPDLRVEYFGGPAVSVYNARQIKSDTLFTMAIAVLILIVFISIAFKSKSAVFLAILPVFYGAVFSLALVFLIKGSVSAIAIGAGTVVFGIALSYSIHVLSHFNHVESISQLIKDLAYPLTIGSLTTIGALMGLLFTSSEILQDFGLFSSFALVGTTLFCLLFLPHLLKKKENGNEPGKLLLFIEKINSYAYEKNKPLVLSLALLFVCCLFLSQKVKFDSDMMHLNYEAPHLKEAEEWLIKLFQSEHKSILFVSTGKTQEEGLVHYEENNRMLRKLEREGKIVGMATAGGVLIPVSEQKERIQRWNTFWTEAKQDSVRQAVEKNALRYHMKKGAFHGFFELLGKKYEPQDFKKDTTLLALTEEWRASSDSLTMFFTQVRLDDHRKEEIYQALADHKNLVVFDRSYFANQWVTSVKDNFYLILYISSFLIFFALLVSYGRIELTLMAFAPMAVSWILILGLMAVAGIPFNIVNIILSTFIFGLGDDFSIFIMDGLQQEYKTGKKMLTAHKTAIFFSSFTAIVGLGALTFARHPALQSLSMISFVGMFSVVLVAYTLLPILFRLFISGPASKGNFPYTFSSLLITLWFFHLFIIGCSLMVGYASLLIPLPIKKEKKKQLFSGMLMHLLRFFLKTAGFVGLVKHNPEKETFEKPAILIANHQSFVDILVLLSLAPKLVMITNHWVWLSPFFGKIVRFADFVQNTDGYENALTRLNQKVKEGYSIVIFPEGTRSSDGKIGRFHKGAFFLAERLKLDIIPVVLYGTGMIISKRQPFYVKRGKIGIQLLPRISSNDLSMGNTYQERTKNFAKLVRQTYQRMEEAYSTPENPYFYQKLITNYLYKGPVEEWYARIKTQMEHRYRFFHQSIPRKAHVTDIGCGYGIMDYLLIFLSEQRTVLGIDYDEEKIALANHNFSRNERIRFVCENALTSDLPASDVFVLNDVLHYMSYSHQTELLDKCLSLLNPGGMLMVRDGDAQQTGKHGLTRLTELFSTRLLAFNKTENELFFPSNERFVRFAQSRELVMECHTNDRYTSNTIYILKKKGETRDAKI